MHIFMGSGAPSYDERPVIILILGRRLTAEGFGQRRGACKVMVGLYMQQGNYAIAEAVIDFPAGSELFIGGIEKLAPETAVRHLGDAR